jgi:hypothetical protein
VKDIVRNCGLDVLMRLSLVKSAYLYSLSIEFHDVIRLVLSLTEAREGSNFFGQFDTDNNGQIDFITFLHSGYAAESAGALLKADRICK